MKKHTNRSGAPASLMVTAENMTQGMQESHINNMVHSASATAVMFWNELCKTKHNLVKLDKEVLFHSAYKKKKSALLLNVSCESAFSPVKPTNE